MVTLKAISTNSPVLSKIEPLRSKILIMGLKEMSVVKKSEIAYLKSDGNYSEIHLLDGEKLYSSKTLKFYQEKLGGEQFYRIHQSFIVNTELIASISANVSELRLSTNAQIPISRSKKAAFKQKLEQWFD